MPPRDWAMPDASAAEALEAGGPDAAVDATITMPTGVADAGFAAARDAGVVPVKRVKPDFRTSTGNLMAPDDVRSPAPTPTTRPRAPTPTPTVPPKSGGR